MPVSRDDRSWCREGESNPQGPKPGGFLRVIAACPTRAHVATSEERSGNTLRSLPRIFCAASALRKRPRTDARRGRPLRRQRSIPGRRVRKSQTARSNRLQSPRTWGSARSGRNRPPLIAVVERPGQACRVLSIQSPKCSAPQRRIRALTEPLPAIANVPRQPFPLRNRAIAAAARTTKPRRPHLLPARRPPSAIGSRGMQDSQNVHPSLGSPGCVGIIFVCSRPFAGIRSEKLRSTLRASHELEQRSRYALTSPGECLFREVARVYAFSKDKARSHAAVNLGGRVLKARGWSVLSLGKVHADIRQRKSEE